MGEFRENIYQGFKYKLYIPGDYKAEINTPLLVMLHGCDQDPDDFAAGTNMNALAEQKNFLVLYPNMNHIFNPSDPAGYNPFGCWNWFLDKNQHRGKGHPKLIVEIVEEVKRGYSIDSSKVYAAGLSAGGSLACILGVTYPDVFHSIAICSGLSYDAANVFFLTDPMAEDAKKSMEKGVADPYACGYSAFQEMGEFKKKMRVIVFHGICDTTVHPINGQQVIIQWAQTNFLVEGGKGNAEVTPILVTSDIMNGKSYTRHIYGDGGGEPLLELWMIDNMGHSWSGGSPNGSYTDPLGPNATEILWEFFTKPHLNRIDKPYDHLPKALVENPMEVLQSLSQLPVPLAVQSPVQTLIQAPLQPTDQSLVQSPDQLPVQYTCQPPGQQIVESSDPPPVQTPAQSPMKALIEPPVKLPKKSIFRTLLAKLIKNKK